MCGICGYIHFDKSRRPSEAILKRMADTLAQRGPDDEGFYIRDNIGFGHRRLSIIDLQGGHQPMTNNDGSIAIVYNGEIYNFPELKGILTAKGHRFKTNSDTEVIIRAYEEYGDDCLTHFNGMFAFALYDSRNDTVLLARDRYGKKPLYYGIFDKQFIFGSELKSMLKHPSVARRIDMDALAKYLSYEYVPAPYSIFKNIYKLEAGSKLILRGGDVKVSHYWDLSFKKKAVTDLEEVKKNILDLLRESVRKRLISDVPLGVFLSGGIDSSAVVAMMAELMDPKDIKTFSIGFREKDFDESSDARRVADHLGTDHREEILSTDVMLDVFPQVADLLDEPFADSSIIPTFLVSRFARKHVTVALGGDGGDEFFLGYSAYKAHKLDAILRNIPGFAKALPLGLLSRSVSSCKDYRSPSYYRKRFLRGLEFPEAVRHQVWTGSFTSEDQKRLYLPQSLPDLDPMKVYASTAEVFKSSAHLDPLDRAIYIYVKTYMTDDILAKVDRASMANSLEVRAPFLDPDLTEYVSSLPSELKLSNFTTKWILKEALKGKLPAENLGKRKQGFVMPVELWLKTGLKGLLLDTFSRKKIEKEGIFDYSYIKNMLDGYISDTKDTRREFWTLFMFEIWYDKYMNQG